MSTTLDNHGERLVPGESHDSAETIRHKSSYRFFKAIIEADNPTNPRILDLGCGVGHGSFTLSTIPGAIVTAIDADAPAIEYAQANYGAENITYIAIQAQQFLDRGETFDYVVSRHALEHIPDGLNLATKFSFQKRLLVNVPFMEPAEDLDHNETNPHHEINDISREHFIKYENPQFFFESMDGVTSEQEDAANSIICAARHSGIPPVSVEIPFAAWKPASRLESIALSSQDLSYELDALKKDFADQGEVLRRLRVEHEELQAAHRGLLSSGSVKTALALSNMLSKIRP
ncbi:class I SAM-dependent methyltransferase [Rhizobium sp. AN80A]|uniref:class I SAM-dependent methyltransferase n=1 Tax=Rhizobium sp. AN80A TaxID=3040673 RepID=UPI0024B373E9|nr:class I SAM-dependent methyltransferase [Rhizobium sp. AN80A]